MGSGNHDTGIRAELAVRVIAHRSRTHAQIDDIRALFRNALCQRLKKRERMGAHVSSDHDFLCLEKNNNGSSDPLGDILVQLFRIDATDIVGFENS